MKAAPKFKGFPKECVEFYSTLATNNTKEWFDAHKGDFETYVMAPARELVHDLGKRLATITPGVVADPRVNRSIFRPYRDTRFSKDKTPYKTHLGIFWWVGPLAKMDCPGYYLHIEPPILMLAVGNHCFSKPILEMYRDAVVDPVQGPALADALNAVRNKGNYEIGIKHYKQIPRGYDKSNPNAELLLFNGLTAAFSTPIPKELHSPRIVDYAFDKLRDMSPVVEWLLDMITHPKA